MKHITDAQMIKALTTRIEEAVGMTVSQAREHVLQGAKSGIEIESLGGTGLIVTLSAYWCDRHRGMESGHVRVMRKPAVFTVAACA